MRFAEALSRHLSVARVTADPAYAAATGPGPGPNFVCIGQAKAGTRWLYDQMRARGGLWMPPVKEINFLVGRSLSTTNRRALAAATRRLCVDSRDAEFFGRLSTYPGSLDFDWYGRLFSMKGDLLSGDISPTYSMLDTNSVGAIAPHLPNTKIILLLREPVSQAWSLVCQFQRTNRLPTALLGQWWYVRMLVDRAQNRQKLYPTRIWAAWSPHFAGRIGYWFLDDIATVPDRVRDDICRFIGAGPGPGTIPAGENVKASRRKVAMPPSIRERLAAYMRPEIEAAASLFGGAAAAWLNAPGSA